MSECKGLRCDRCSARTLAPEHGSNIPDGWSVMKVMRNKPFLDSQKDLCPMCTEQVMAVFFSKVCSTVEGSS